MQVQMLLNPGVALGAEEDRTVSEAPSTQVQMLLNPGVALGAEEHRTVSEAPSTQVQMLLNPGVALGAEEHRTVSEAPSTQVQMLLNPELNPGVTLGSVAHKSGHKTYKYEPGHIHPLCQDCNGMEIVPPDLAAHILCRVGLCGSQRKVEEEMINLAIMEKDIQLKKCKCQFSKLSWWWRSPHIHKRKHFSPFQSASYVRNEIHKRLRLWGFKSQK
jgi:hypothetical protein